MRQPAPLDEVGEPAVVEELGDSGFVGPDEDVALGPTLERAVRDATNEDLIMRIERIDRDRGAVLERKYQAALRMTRASAEMRSFLARVSSLFRRRRPTARKPLP